MYEDATWYGRTLGAIHVAYFCILVILKGQGRSIKFKVKLKRFSEWLESHRKSSGDVNMQILRMTVT